MRAGGHVQGIRGLDTVFRALIVVSWQQVGVFKAGSAVVVIAEALHASDSTRDGRFRFGVRTGERVQMGQRLDS